MIPSLDKEIGIDVYSTNFDGCGGKIRKRASDFQVFEVIEKKILSSLVNDGYALYLLKKHKIDTNHALDSIFRKTGIRLKALGLKDANALTEQYVCSMNRSKHIDKFESDKISFKKIGFLSKPLSKKNMIGNKFVIRIFDHDDTLEKFKDYDKILNFYGYQRFGTARPVSHLIGKSIIQKNFKQAIEYLLTFTSSYDSEENIELRTSLRDPDNYERLFSKIPLQMDLERSVLKSLIDHKNNYVRALRALPLVMRRFFVQAYQSYLFNKTLSFAKNFGENLLACQENDVCYDKQGILQKFQQGLNAHLAIPLVGYSYFKKTRFNYYISKILQDEEVSPQDFFIKELQEASNEGGFRHSIMVCDEFSVCGDTVSFTISRGSYATILLREIMKPSDPVTAGF